MNKYKTGDRVVRTVNGRWGGGAEGDDFYAKVGMRATVKSLHLLGLSPRVVVRIDGRGDSRVWYLTNCVSEEVWDSPLYQALL